MSQPARPLELPPVPPVIARRGSFTCNDQAAYSARSLIELGMQALRAQAARTGVAVPNGYELVVLAAQVAAPRDADMRTSTDVREPAISAESTSGSWVSVRDAARLFDVGHRQARRIVEQAGGTKTPKGWRIHRDALHAEFELRRTA